MNDQAPNINVIQDEPSKIDVLKKLVARLRQALALFWLKFSQVKFFANKKILWIVCAAIGFIAISVIIVLIITKGKNPKTSSESNSSPIPQEEAQSSIVGLDTLVKLEQKLGDLKNQIENLDVKQERLQPPEMDFKISF